MEVGMSHRVGEGRRYENNINIVLTLKILKIKKLNEKV